MPKHLFPKDKRYFEAVDESEEYQKLKTKEEIRMHTPDLLRLWKTFRKYEREGYKPPITEKEWKRAINIYVDSLGQLSY